MKGKGIPAGQLSKRRTGLRFTMLAAASLLAAAGYSQFIIYAASRADLPAKPAPAEAAADRPHVAAANPIALPPLPRAAPAEREFRDAPAVIEPDSARVDLPSLDLPALQDLLRDETVATASVASRPRLAAFTPGPAAPKELPGDRADTPWRANAVPFTDRPGLKLIAIIIDDAGLNRPGTARAIRLPGPLTIAFLPYAGEIQRQADEARRRGHELMLHMPMEPISPFENPGPDALTTWLKREEIQRRMLAALARFEGFVGVNNHMGSRMTLDMGAMLPVLELVRDRGLLFVDSRTIGSSIAGPLADRLGVPGTARDVFIDHEDDAHSVAARLEDIERIARRQGQAVAIGHPHERTLDALERWLPGLAERGFTLAPISAVALRRQKGAEAALR